MRYVARTHETVVLNDAINEGHFTNDPYIQQYQCQSILCTPLINQSHISGTQTKKRVKLGYNRYRTVISRFCYPDERDNSSSHASLF